MTLPIIQRTLNCCGWREILQLRYYFGDFDAVLKSFIHDGGIGVNGKAACGAFLFTTNMDEVNYSNRFSRDIRSRGLGRVTRLRRFVNPNTGRTITSYMWTPDNEKLAAYCKENQLLPQPYKAI